MYFGDESIHYGAQRIHYGGAEIRCCDERKSFLNVEVYPLDRWKHFYKLPTGNDSLTYSFYSICHYKYFKKCLL